MGVVKNDPLHLHGNDWFLLSLSNGKVNYFSKFFFRICIRNDHARRNSRSHLRKLTKSQNVLFAFAFWNPAETRILNSSTFVGFACNCFCGDGSGIISAVRTLGNDLKSDINKYVTGKKSARKTNGSIFKRHVYGEGIVDFLGARVLKE